MFQDAKVSVVDVVAAMTDEEKVDLLSGRGLWKTAAIARLNVPSIIMTDGTYGVRYSTTQIDAGDDDEDSLQQFLAVVNQEADEDTGMFGTTLPATCFPNGNLIGCSWDYDLTYRMGQALAAECHQLGVQLLLGPGINTRRTPLAGRAYEYYSEDPVINGDLAAALISGLQDNGIGASLKHFACNNSEIDRTNTSSDVSERALREIYLAGFERAIAKSAPWTVMSAYNPVNGVQAAENQWLLTQVLRQEWGYDGLVVSDWHAIKDRPASLAAGTELDMPESKPRKAQLLAALKTGEIDRQAVDAACGRMLDFVRKCLAAKPSAPGADLDRHHALARDIAAESIVLLKNEKAVLPLDTATIRRLLVVGDGAVKPQIQGSGSATTNPYLVDTPLSQIEVRASGRFVLEHLPTPHGTATEIEAHVARICERAGEVDAVVVFAENEKGRNGEGNDRDTLDIVPAQNAVIAALAGVADKLVVVLTMPDAVEMPWLETVPAALACFYPGQGGGEAIARILFGEQNPCGKLSATMPAMIEDIPGWHSYPGEHGRHLYSEGIFVGYRYYDLKSIAPAFPFGHGLSYTTFGYEDLAIDASAISPGSSCNVTLTIRNTGTVPGKEIVQIYVRPVAPGLKRPIRELKAFAKIALQPGESRSVTFSLAPRDFQYFDTSRGSWVLQAEAFVIEAAASSRDIRLSQVVPCRGEPLRPPAFTEHSAASAILADAAAAETVRAFIAEKLAVSDDEASIIAEKVRGSFLGFHESLSWFIGDSISREDVVALLSNLNNDDRG